ncbi:MAG: hypothetical protein ICV83_33565 [Cytophagales bacterium]|nr:hypothetical protein [Cytophagales bacterium]
MKPVRVSLSGLAAVCLLTLSVGTRTPEAAWTVTLRDDSIRIMTNPKGPTLGYSAAGRAPRREVPRGPGRQPL